MRANWTVRSWIGMILAMKGFKRLTARRRRAGISRTTSVPIAIVACLAAGPPALADLKLPPRPRGDPAMRIVRVTSSDPACEPNCPEWISAEGTIRPGTAGVFAKAIADLGGRRLPVLMSSHGGSVGDAIRMAFIIREHGLATAVARTLINNCPERAPQCPGARGQAITGGAVCASACPLVLAGGVERFVGPVPMVGVHQITTIMKETEGSAHLTTIKKIYEPDSADAAVERYWTAMGIGDPVMTLLRKTSAGSIRWLSPGEITASHLATQALDPSEPVLTKGANGLNGHSFEGAPSHPDPLTATGTAEPDPAGVVEATLTFRRGGGAVEFALADRSGDPKASALRTRWTVTGGGDALPMMEAGAAQAKAAIPRERFCALAREGKLVAVPGGVSPQQPVTFDLARMDGAGALVAEACP
jgi:hypothetical protein